MLPGDGDRNNPVSLQFARTLAELERAGMIIRAPDQVRVTSRPDLHVPRRASRRANAEDWPAIEALADALLEHGSLAQAEVQQTVRDQGQWEVNAGDS